MCLIPKEIITSPDCVCQLVICSLPEGLTADGEEILFKNEEANYFQ